MLCHIYVMYFELRVSTLAQQLSYVSYFMLVNFQPCIGVLSQVQVRQLNTIQRIQFE